MSQYKKFNNITGWIVFSISLAVYLITLEPTVSFWDCGEFISCAFKLEVGHPPGAPFFMLMGRIFSMMAGGDTTKVAYAVNSMSALASAFTILFLFWSITHLARKIIAAEQYLTTGKLIAILGSGIVGALGYTFTDSFWFSAVEGEVYATSSLFTAIVFWAILKWEDESSLPHANRWLILIAYLMGLSIGVHLLNLLAIPAIVLVYYFKKFTPTSKGVLTAVGLSFVILAVVMYGIIQGIVKIAGIFELLFVNNFGFGYNSGFLFYLLLLTILIVSALAYTHRKGYEILNTILVCFMVIMIGYSSYALVVIRSMADPPMDQNNPENLFNLLAYLNREQYGDRPLIKGQYYNAPVVGSSEGKPFYSYINGRYEVTMRKPVYTYDSRFETLFPRMHSSSPDHVEQYKRWGKIQGRRIQVNDGSATPRTEIVPTFGENLRFFFRYQLGFMYFRYFMWNFSGRQNDIQGHGNVINGNWICGIPALDNARLGPQEKLPDELKNNPGRNRYYMLPLLLGLIGGFYHYRKTKRDFSVVGLLFFMTGIAIVIYLNQTPLQPRERDYAYAASFYAFAIWIGLGVLALYEFMQKKIHSTISSIVVTVITLLLVPGVLAAENWDDHNRARRYTARDFAYNYLQSCEKNGFIFTNGDNDTFPLWYAQEVEGIRTDVRVVNLSYIGADWYIDQMKRRAYESAPLPISFTRSQYLQGRRDVIYLIDRGIATPVDIREALKFIASDDPNTKYNTGDGSAIEYLPTKQFRFAIDTMKVLRNGTVPASRRNDVEKEMTWQINRNYIIKNDLMVLDLLATNNWERPMYFAITVSSDNYLNLEKYFHMHGLAYRVMPVYAAGDMIDVGGMDTDIMYDRLMNGFRWGGVNDERVYLNEDNRRMLSNYRSNFARVATELLKINKKDSAMKLLDRCMELIPDSRIPYNYFNLAMADAYLKLDKREMAEEILNTLAQQVQQNLDFYISLREKAMDLDYEKKLNLHIMQEILKRGDEHKIETLGEKLYQKFSEYLTILSPTLKG